MSAIQTNNLSLNQESINTDLPAYPSKISNASNLYLGSGSTNVPGITNIFFAPYDFFQSIVAMVKAQRMGDKEGVAENGLRVLSTQFSFSYAVVRIAMYVVQIGLFFKIISQAINYSLIPLVSVLSGFGFVICFLEGALETIGLARTAYFYSDYSLPNLHFLQKALTICDPQLRQQKFSKILEEFSKASELPENTKREIGNFLINKDLPTEQFYNQSKNILDQIEINNYLRKLKKLEQKYLKTSSKKMLQIERIVQKKLDHAASSKSPEQLKVKMESAHLTMKKNALVRRIQPWLADEIEKTVPQMIQNLQSCDLITRNEAKAKAAEIFYQIKQQSQKKFLLHATGILAVLFTLAGLIFGSMAFPLVIPFCLMIIGGILAYSQYCINAGLMDSKGWDFKVKNCIPGFIKAIYKKIFSTEEKKSSTPYSLFLDFDFNRYQNSFSNSRYSYNSGGLDFSMTVPLYLKV